MAGITIESTNLEHLRCLAVRLTQAVGILATEFEEEATRLRRRDQVARLKALRFAVLERVEWAKIEERAASGAHSQFSAATSLFLLGAGLTTMTSENKTMRATVIREYLI